MNKSVKITVYLNDNDFYECYYIGDIDQNTAIILFKDTNKNLINNIIVAEDFNLDELSEDEFNKIKEEKRFYYYI